MVSANGIGFSGFNRQNADYARAPPYYLSANTEIAHEYTDRIRFNACVTCTLKMQHHSVRWSVSIQILDFSGWQVEWLVENKSKSSSDCQRRWIIIPTWIDCSITRSPELDSVFPRFTVYWATFGQIAHPIDNFDREHRIGVWTDSVALWFGLFITQLGSGDIKRFWSFCGANRKCNFKDSPDPIRKRLWLLYESGRDLKCTSPHGEYQYYGLEIVALFQL